jgi:hypothetical protein
MRRATQKLTDTMDIFTSSRSADTAAHPVIWRNLHNAMGITKYQQGDYIAAQKSLQTALDICQVD